MGEKIVVTWPVSEGELRQSYEKEKDGKLKQRLLALLHVKSGKSARETAKIIFVSKNTVSLWCKRFNELGFEGLNDKDRSGRPRGVNYDALKSALDSSPQNYGYAHQAWYPKLVVTYLIDHQNLKLGKNYVYNLIRRMGYRLKVPRTRSYKSDPKKVIDFKKK